MRKSALFLLFIFSTTICFAQELFRESKDGSQHIEKPLIDSSVYDKWPSVEGATISNDGNYAMYSIMNQPVGSRTLVLQAIKGNWRTEIQHVDRAEFTQDSQTAVCINPNDSLCIVRLGSTTITYIPQVNSFKLQHENSDVWLAYQLNTLEKEVVTMNLKTGKKISYSSVKDYLFSADGRVLVLQMVSKKDTNTIQSLRWGTLGDGNIATIWEGTGIENIVLDAGGTQLAFIVESKINSQKEKSIWYYKAGTARAVNLATKHAPGIENGLALGSIQHFSKDGNRLFFTLEEKEGNKPSPNGVQVDVWSYTDTKLQSQQFDESGPESYAAVINIAERHIVRLEQAFERISSSDFNHAQDTVAMIRHQQSDGKSGEWNWNPACKLSWYLVSTKNGEKQPLDWLADNFWVEMSPEGKYVIYYDKKQKEYFSYETASGVIRNITQGIATSWERDYGRVIGGWMKEDAAVIIYDQYDVWQIDPTGKTPALNLTNGFGLKHNIVFFMALDDYPRHPLGRNEELIFTAFNRNTKDNGFYRKIVGKTGDPDSLTMGPYLYDVTDNPYLPSRSNFTPVKATDVKVYIIKRMNAAESPNFFSTTNFKTFTQLSDLHPEKKYNWYSAELHTWKSLDGSALQGILYKPENFDSTKKYPVIFHYYEIKSDRLNAYLKPDLADGGTICIPCYVSNGYLVFTPDIHYTIGDPFQGTYNAVVSAAHYLSRFPYVNTKKMGLQGLSWGAIQTNYLITQTDIFAAACSASGIADLISGYGGLISYGASLQGMYESGQLRFGASLWEKPERYIKNSAILQADKITTPLLMMHTKNDGVCPFANAIELFTALRRLGKKSWMLVYEGNHGVFGKDGDDFNIRMAQFFDHYLKDKPAPKWMTRGIPAKLKGIDDGLELDTTVKTPGVGLLMEGN
ncbi:prolyl oligopeptidase family protein [Chitinophaga niastensis]|uniref:Prolyl oligopeptidase family protein n=1 Tax=Chitinophaga niastensis TaxID=536980 RepID=A0A2P8HQ85_CHINA|nr:prolyl oligopeptidase family serine peptidase [Chitinophaga niastensis]PSL48366.1 prolyl oligopeptidase family protein [Chitinophaga niastensis]